MRYSASPRESRWIEFSGTTGSTDVGAEVESSPTERRSYIDWRRRIDRRTRANFSGIRRYRKCQQRRYGGSRMEQLAHALPRISNEMHQNLNSKDPFSANPLSRPMKESLSLLRNYNKARYYRWFQSVLRG